MKKKVKIVALMFLGIMSLPLFSQQSFFSTQEKAYLGFMLEEEKLAGDVYKALNDKWDLQIFENIVQAEERHLDAVLELMTDHGMNIPTAFSKHSRGNFLNGELQTLYDELVSTGMKSKKSALKVGAKIEEKDITDLRESLSKAENDQIINLYTRLEEASEKHLRAFNRNLNNLGVNYKPQVLSQDDFDEIIYAADGKGLGAGKGKAGCKGKSSCKGKKSKGKCKKEGCKKSSLD